MAPVPGHTCRSSTLAALYHAGKLVDPELDPHSAAARRQARQRYEAAAEYVAIHFALLAASGEPQRAKLGRWYAAAMTAPPGRGRLLGHQVLERAVLYEMPPESPGQEDTLRRVLQGFIDSANP